MMHCFIYSREELIGHADFAAFDPGMGGAFATFCPHKNYERIRAVVQDFSQLGSLADIKATEATKRHAEEVMQRCQTLCLTARTAVGELLEPAVEISLWDYSEDLGEAGYEIVLFGLPHEIAEKYFHEAIQQYWGTDAEGS